MGLQDNKNLGFGLSCTSKFQFSLTLFEEGGPTGPGPGGPDWGWPIGYMVTKRTCYICPKTLKFFVF